jgi:hypothetical protein
MLCPADVRDKNNPHFKRERGVRVGTRTIGTSRRGWGDESKAHLLCRRINQRNVAVSCIISETIRL